MADGGIQSEAPRGINVGATAQPLVTSAAEVVTPNATAQLVDAFRKGFIGADDIVQRINDVGMAKQKAELNIAGAQSQAAQEFVGPTAQQARDTALQAAIWKAQATPGNYEAKLDALTRAGVSIPGVSLEGGLSPAQRQQIDTEFGSVMNWATQRAMAEQFRKESKIEDRTVKSIGPRGEEETKVFPGEQVRGPSGEVVDSKRFHEIVATSMKPYAVWKAEGQPSFHGKPLVPPGTVIPPTTPTISAPAATAAAPPQPDISMLRDALIKTRGISPDFAARMSDEDVQRLASKIPEFSAAAATAAIAPVITPIAPPGASAPKPEISAIAPPVAPAIEPRGFVTETKAAPAPKAAEITEQFRKQKSYESWNSALGFYNNMSIAIDKINKVPIEEQRSGRVNMNAKDIELISNFIKLYDPAATIREFKFDKVSTSQPVIDRLENWRSTLLRGGILTPEARQDLFETATDALRGKEQSIIPDLKMAVKRGERAGYDISEILNPAEQNLVSGQTTASYTRGGKTAVNAPAAAGWGPPVTLSNGMTVRRGPDGQYYKQ